jgi:hypothetical protein
MKTFRITDNDQIEFAIQRSRSHNEIVSVHALDTGSARQWLVEHYDVGVCWLAQERAYDVWATEGDWRIFLS